MKTIKILSLSIATLFVVSCNKGNYNSTSLKTELDSVSYAVGMDIARGVGSSFDEINKDLLVQGYLNASDSSKLLIEKDKVQQFLQTYMMKKREDMMKKQKEEALKKAEEQFGANKAEGEKFLAENISKEGIETTESGLQYIVLKEGTGDNPVATSKVKVHYHGTRINGEVFDSSVERGKPEEFKLNAVVSGWTEGIQLMNLGAKYKFFIPQNLAYGAFPRQGGKIKPFDVLIFEVELLEIVK
ncbi:FKBP-type peptidyl-prolyl cis-trans isomerase [Flavivirga eckloniae]|uniref:Peptidyl-prolyl cis-trans isomerase n=1 Tax=Flavivirga eckloniae TaxID=1803846 RepID=A0A2K9PNM0_9FLAO|nr:FKBP-type peptidyl-prolyl cis-trans isomerase [Flavivirga eckloniae]AUP78670.1 peptidylprolyl isomerase [Flavivirga eckloniae]